MKIPSLVLGGMASTLVAVSILACTSSVGAPDPADQPAENLGAQKQALCRFPPCVGADPTTSSTVVHRPPPPEQQPGPGIACTGSAVAPDGNIVPWTSTTPDGFACTSTTQTPACGCNQVEQCHIDGGICYGFSVISHTTCPSPFFPVLRCNAFGDCSCWSY